MPDYQYSSGTFLTHLVHAAHLRQHSHEVLDHLELHMQECLALMIWGAYGCYTVPHAFHLPPARENTRVGCFLTEGLDNMQDLKDRRHDYPLTGHMSCVIT